MELGKSLTCIGFHSNSGIVEYGNKELYNYNFKLVYGETLGIGMRWSDGRIWLTQNGKFLNPPPKAELQKDDDDEKDGEDKKKVDDEPN
jgi:hypothetical protein